MLATAPAFAFSRSSAAPAYAFPVIVGKSINSDAAQIELAGRVEALARRCEQVFTRGCDIRDFVEARCPPRPIPPEPPSTTTSEWRDTADMRVFTMRQPLADPAHAEWRRLSDADKEAVERDRAAMGARLGLPEVERRHDRMWRRLHRWTADLAGIEATTVQGVAAKAGAVLSIVDPLETGPLAASLILSTLCDVARIGSTSA